MNFLQVTKLWTRLGTTKKSSSICDSDHNIDLKLLHDIYRKASPPRWCTKLGSRSAEDAEANQDLLLLPQPSDISTMADEALSNDSYPQSAEYIAVIIAQQKTLTRYEKLRSNLKPNVKICTDSKNAVGCMTAWLETWRGNGWRNSKGREIVGLDLILEPDYLNDELRELGTLEYVWISRNENTDADWACKEAMDRAILYDCP